MKGLNSKDVQMTEKEITNLIESYYQNKTDLESYKTICDTQNKQIKQELNKLGKNAFSTESLTAKIKHVKKESFDELKLLQFCKDNNITDCIKTKEYVDSDILENLIYAEKIPVDKIARMHKCIKVSEYDTLTISVNKHKEEN